MKVQQISIGSRVERLLILDDLGLVDMGYACGKKIRRLKVQCDCGKVFNVNKNSITSNKTKSCGCFKKETILNQHIKHSLYKHPLFKIWQGIKKRCYNKNCSNFYGYGGRGIKMCDTWQNDFNSFYNWAIENGWRKGLHIDRIDVDGNYEIDNCRFVTQKENNRNRRNTIYITSNNVKKTIGEWSEETGIKYATIKSRFMKGWNINRVLS